MKKANVTYADFEKLDFRIGEIKAAEAVSWSKKLLQFTVDLGEDYGTVTIFSGISKWYSPEEFVGKKYIFLANLEPKKMGESFSQGMMVMADAEERPTVFTVPDEIPNGTVVR